MVEMTTEELETFFTWTAAGLQPPPRYRWIWDRLDVPMQRLWIKAVMRELMWRDA